MDSGALLVVGLGVVIFVLSRMSEPLAARSWEGHPSTRFKTLIGPWLMGVFYTAGSIGVVGLIGISFDLIPVGDDGWYFKAILGTAALGIGLALLAALIADFIVCIWRRREMRKPHSVP